jgi:hypothetical protein
MPPSTGFSGTHFSALTSVRINVPEGPEKYSNTDVKYRDHFTAATQNLTHAKRLKPNVSNIQCFLYGKYC